MTNIAYASYSMTTTDTDCYPPASGYSNLIPHSDNFNSPAGVNSFYWTPVGTLYAGGNSVSASGGQLEIQVNGLGGTYDGVVTSLQTQILNSSVSCALTQLGNADTGGSGTFLGLQVSPTSTSIYGLPTPPFSFPPDPTGVPNLRISCSEGDLLCTYNNLGGISHDQTIVSVTYDPVNHKYLQISDAIVSSTETAFFSTSPDGVTWTQVASTPTVSSCAASLTVAYACMFAYGVSSVSSQTYGIGDYAYAGVPQASPPQAVASASAVILTPAGDFVAATGQGLPDAINAAVNYGDPVHLVEANLTAAIRQAAGDPALNVVFTPGR